jgi:hypothetical protein
MIMTMFLKEVDFTYPISVELSLTNQNMGIVTIFSIVRSYP